MSVIEHLIGILIDIFDDVSQFSVLRMHSTIKYTKVSIFDCFYYALSMVFLYLSPFLMIFL